jgi:hypothetical protein
MMSFASYRLWETAPAERFADAHLLGNGRLGAAVFGTAPDDRIAIEEMVAHEFLDEAGTKQRATYADGTVVTADLSAKRWKAGLTK